jgi:hypothetical protein
MAAEKLLGKAFLLATVNINIYPMISVNSFFKKETKMANLSPVGTPRDSHSPRTIGSSADSNRAEVNLGDLGSNPDVAAPENALSQCDSFISTHEGSYYLSQGSSDITWSPLSKPDTDKAELGTPDSRKSVKTGDFLPFYSPDSNYGTGSPEPFAQPPKTSTQLPPTPPLPFNSQNK